MHYFASLQCILAARSKSVVFSAKHPFTFLRLPVSVSLCLDLWKHFSHSQHFFIPVSLSLWCSHFALSYFYSPPPSHSHALFCSLSALWCFSYTRNITLTFSLCLPHPDTHVHSTSLSTSPSFTSEASIHLCLSVPSSHIPRLSLKSSEP